jgi:Spy/CpxP family protein refolding chaperone
MFHRNLSFLSVALLSVTLSWGAPAKGDHGGHDRDMGRFATYLEKELALTPTQTAQVREILKPDSLIGPPPFGMEAHQVLPLAGEFVDQLRAASVDTAALNRLFEQRTALHRERYARAQMKFTMLHGVLTMEQRHKLADILQKRLDRVEARHEKKKDAKKK